MQVTMEKNGKIGGIRVPGEYLDVNSAKDFKTQVVPFLGEAGHVIIELEAVTFVDSSVSGVLLACLRQVQSNGGELRLCGLHSGVRSLYEVVRMNRVFTISETPRRSNAVVRAIDAMAHGAAG